MKNFKKHRKYIPIKGGTFIRLPNGKVTSKSQVPIPDKKSLFSVNGNGQIWTKDDPNQTLLFKVGQETENVERKIVPFTPSKNPYKKKTSSCSGRELYVRGI